MKNLSINDFEKMFGSKITSNQHRTINLIRKFNFSYSIIKEKKLDDLLLDILNKIEGDKQNISSFKRKKVWNKGWGENLNFFNNNKNNKVSLIPKFIRPNKPFRLFQKYCESKNKNFELDFISVYRTWFYEKYLQNVENIYEFGCGTGFNLVEFSKYNFNQKLFGSDFVMSSVKLVNKFANFNNINLQSELFDMKIPNKKYLIKDNSGVFTFGSIEQLSGKYKKFINYLIRNKPQIVIHTEPCEELYDTNVLNDYLAFKFQNKRGYSSGLIEYLKKKEKQKKIRILKIKRLYFGSLFMEGYNHICWKPL